MRMLRQLFGVVIVTLGLACGIGFTALTYADATWMAGGQMASPRYMHIATLLQNGQVLVAGGNTGTSIVATAERYDPTTKGWHQAAQMMMPRAGALAALLPNGQVLVMGGLDSQFNFLVTTELYDPASDQWRSAASMHSPHLGGAMTVLTNGRVLVAGGSGAAGTVLNSAELYDSVTNQWQTTADMQVARSGTATLLMDGRVLVAGGDPAPNDSVRSTAEVYDPVNNRWASAGTMLANRATHQAVLLHNGKVLVIGGANTALAEVYDPGTNGWSEAGQMSDLRFSATATLLPDGQVLVAGGNNKNVALATSERFDPASNRWSLAGDMTSPRINHQATLLPNGQVLVSGGRSNIRGEQFYATTDLYGTAGASGQCFSETNKCVQGRLLYYWETNGALPVFGLPLSDEGLNATPDGTFQTQLFERNRLELHPEKSPPYDVLLGRLGTDLLAKQGRPWETLPREQLQTGCKYFPQTQHNLCEPFLSYWRSHGLDLGDPGISERESLALFGYPVTTPAMEKNSSGDTVMTQWFERARFEQHPENKPPYDVLLGRLGAESK